MIDISDRFASCPIKALHLFLLVLISLSPFLALFPFTTSIIHHSFGMLIPETTDDMFAINILKLNGYFLRTQALIVQKPYLLQNLVVYGRVRVHYRGHLVRVIRVGAVQTSHYSEKGQKLRTAEDLVVVQNHFYVPIAYLLSNCSIPSRKLLA